MIYTLRELAPMLNVSYRTLQRWIVAEKIKPTHTHQFGNINRYFFDEEDLKKIQKGLVGVRRLTHKI